MKHIVLIITICLFPLFANAQASGGQVKRSTKTVSKTGDKPNMIKDAVRKWNRQCPLGNEETVVTNFKYDGNTIEMYITSKRNPFSVALWNKNEADFREFLCMSLKRRGLDFMINSNLNVRAICYDTSLKQKMSVFIPLSELKEILDRQSRMTEDEYLIMKTIFATRIYLPADVDNTMKMVDFYLSNGVLAYKYECNNADEVKYINNYAIAFAKYKTMSYIAEGIKGEKPSGINKDFLQALVNCNIELDYEYREVNTNTKMSYRITTAEINEILMGKYDNQVYSEPMSIDLGLPSGTLWADRNVGANSSEEAGYSYCWGDVVPSCLLSGKVKYCNDNDGEYIKYNRADGLLVMQLSDDAAYVNLGSKWHTPTSEQMRELLNEINTYKIWQIQNGIRGLRIVSRKNGNSIFLPVDSLICEYYWTANLVYPDFGKAYSAVFTYEGSMYEGLSHGNRNTERRIRPVRFK